MLAWMKILPFVDLRDKPFRYCLQHPHQPRPMLIRDLTQWCISPVDYQVVSAMRRIITLAQPQTREQPLSLPVASSASSQSP